MKIPANSERNATHAPYPEAEADFVRSRFRLPPDEPIGPWIEYCRAWSRWRERCNELVTWILNAPERYVRDLAGLYERRRGQAPSQGWRLSHLEAIEVLQAQLMEYARPGQGQLLLALEILGHQAGQPRCRPVIAEMITGGWLPKEPRRPSETKRERESAERARRSGITEAQRQANAARLVESF